MNSNINIDIVSVKVMRSHDYCHFEVNLSSSSAATPEQVDELRKTAARLADKAVEQYKTAKRNCELIASDAQERTWESRRIARLEEVPETERTPEDQARIKAFRDKAYIARRRFDYEDEWEESDDDRGPLF